MSSSEKSIILVSSAKIGDILIKNRKGKPYFAMRPRGGKLLPGEFSEANKKFKTCAGFASSLLKSKLLRETWKKAAPDYMTPYNLIIKKNMPHCIPESGISGLKLVPDETSVLIIPDECSYSNVEFSAKITLTAIPLRKEKVSMQGAIRLFDPVDPQNKQFDYVPVISTDYQLITGDLTLHSYFSSQDSEIIKAYNSRQILINFALKDFQGGGVVFSEEYAYL